MKRMVISQVQVYGCGVLVEGFVVLDGVQR